MSKIIQSLFIDLANEFPKCNIYLYGSQVYGTQTELSDYDFIIVGTPSDFSEKRSFGDITCLTWESFQLKLDEHDISQIECMFLSPSQKYEHQMIKWSLDLTKLRSSCSAKASNSWIKAKKKLEVEDEPYIAQKSLFHSLRILKFAISLAESKSIDFHQQNLWNEVKSLPLDWETWNKTFKPTYNELKSHLRTLSPKY